MPIAHLDDRGVIKVTGEDAEKLLGSLITNEIALLRDQPAIYAGLLTPQGKLISDFFIVREVDGYLIDIALDKRAEVAAKLKIYRLRSKVVIEDAPELGVTAIFGDGPLAEGVVFTDPRLPEMGHRVIAAVGSAAPHSAAPYHAHRIRLGVPEGGKDWDFAGAFPHEALFDQLHGVSFTKGCYVGQEIVARMEHRGTARSRVVKVVGEDALPETRADILAGDVVIGKLGSVADREGLALLRIDRAAEFIAKGQPITSGGVVLRLEVPAFARFAIAG